MHKLALGASRGALVVKELTINEEGPVFVRLVGRRGGLLAWLLALIGIDPTTTMNVTASRIELTEGSLSGKVRHMVPLSAICNLGTGYFKPIALLALGFVLLVFSLSQFIAIAFFDVDAGYSFAGFSVLLFSAASFAAYSHSKTLVLFAMSGSGMGTAVGFRRSAIEGVSVDEQQARKVVEIMTKLVEDKTR